MKIGDLVTPRDTPKEQSRRPSHYFGKIGIIVEWDPAFGNGWVKWPFNFDWDIEYEEDLELVSEGR